MALKSLSVKISEDVFNRIENLAVKTHRTKTFYVEEALNNYLEDIEDTYLALQRLENPGKTYSMTEVARELGFTKDEEKEIGLDNKLGRKSPERIKKTRQINSKKNS